MASRIEEIIESYNNDRLEGFCGDRSQVRQYLLAKTLEEFGEYAEIASMSMFVTARKAEKHGLIGEDGFLDDEETAKFLFSNLKAEAGDLVWMALSIAFHEGHNMRTLTAYLETRKDAAKTLPTD